MRFLKTVTHELGNLCGLIADEVSYSGFVANRKKFRHSFDATTRLVGKLREEGLSDRDVVRFLMVYLREQLLGPERVGRWSTAWQVLRGEPVRFVEPDEPMHLPEEPTEIGTELVVHADGEANGDRWVREDVEKALNGRHKCWRLTYIASLEMYHPRTRYSTWNQVWLNALAESRAESPWIEVVSPELPRSAPPVTGRVHMPSGRHSAP